MNRPTGWAPNPQAMAAGSAKRVFEGHPELGASVDTDTWLTPRYILAHLGEFDLDPCAADGNPTWVCERHYLKADDGLRQPWGGRVFMNPPFSDTVPWLQRHAEHGIGISLVPASVESRTWRSDVWPKAKAVLLLHGRTRFCAPSGAMTVGRPLRSVALIAWSESDAEVLGQCPLAGVLLRDWSQR